MSPADFELPRACPASVADIAAVPARLLETPLKYILADHFRQRCFWGHLRRHAAAGQVSREEANAIVLFLTKDLGTHQADEEEDLFPAMRQRAVAGDDLDSILTLLTVDHRHFEARIDAIVAALSRHQALDNVPLSHSCAQSMLECADKEHRHLSLENGIVLVIAQRRLTATDLAAMAHSMKARRGVTS